MSYSAPLAYAPPCLWFRCFILYSGCLSVSLCLVNVWRATECRATVTVRKFFLSVRTVFFQLTVWYRLFGLGFIKCVFSFLFDLGAVMGCERVARSYNVRVMCDGSVFEHIMSGVRSKHNCSGARSSILTDPDPIPNCNYKDNYKDNKVFIWNIREYY